ncbi:hypothetical protein [Burkholderia pseudomallei]|uniref:hypothetical protein n=1 Tax=Burkholderia pseudomallei TaxID=28450 RepID=UPI0011AB8C5A|nr:hypothetical protein [Burkholderia pseudomallei]
MNNDYLSSLQSSEYFTHTPTGTVPEKSASALTAPEAVIAQSVEEMSRAATVYSQNRPRTVVKRYSIK